MFRFAIDRGGTFTDVYAELPDGSATVLKLLSVDPAYPDAPREGIRRVMSKFLGHELDAAQPIPTQQIESIRMGTTVATNALLERKGERMALAITAGFRDLLHIGNQARPKLFDLDISMPEVLYEQARSGSPSVVEVDERILLSEDGPLQGATGERLEIRQALDEAVLRQQLQKILDAGIRCLAVVLMHSYLHVEHEQRVGQIARDMGFTHVSLSSDVMQMAKIVPRGFTACADAYLTPAIHQYLRSFAGGFEGDLAGVRVLFMQSDGGLTPMDRFVGSRAIVSGPAAGVVGYALAAFDGTTPVVGFDMGGTSTDVSRFGGSFEHVFETTIAGTTIQVPQLDINTVAAGGGSRLFFRAGMFVVGPESAGAHPGPTCYRKGGPLTVTDANLLLGRIRPADFPNIFGENNDEPLDEAATRAAFDALTNEINAYMQAKAQETGQPLKTLTPQEVALGFVDVANEAMCRPIRSLTQARGFNISTHTLACFGGAGGQHACAIAQSLGMARIHISKYSGILSAHGLAAADVVREEQEPCASVYSEKTASTLFQHIQQLATKARDALVAEGFSEDKIIIEPFLNMRYRGTDCAQMTTIGSATRVSFTQLASLDPQAFLPTFLEQYKREFGFTIPGRDILVDDVRVRATGVTRHVASHVPKETGPAIQPSATHTIYFRDGKPTETPVYRFSDLSLSDRVQGPALMTAATSTILIEPNCQAQLTKQGDLEVIVGEGTSRRITTDLDLIHLSLFQHRFMTIAEQMGRALQRTSISTNIKERLDFSCALFSPDGGLTSNAPHIPVHLGAMQEAVRYQIGIVDNDLQAGDVLVSNHPAAGGSHLPDITVVTPFFRAGHAKPVFWVASRGHHADIGGITPGSMPPHSKSLLEEGAAIKSFKLVRGGQFQEEGITELLMEPKKYPNSSGTRNLSDNLSDLKAQVAANQRGIELLNHLMDEMGEDVVIAYMKHIQENAEVAVRDMLKAKAQAAREARGTTRLHCRDFLDDGSPIELTVDIDEATGSATFDFTGTGPQVLGNLNTPRAVAYSAVIYCLRCMIGHDVPLNQGCLVPVTINIPRGSLIWPSDDAAVVGGNVLTSQRLCDVILKAFGACADSQGCMNNVTFGNERVGYYETIAGGSGAGPGFDGRSGVHTHMTNTRITDPEVVERRYPVVVERFHLRENSGGQGLYRGGNGVVRELRFREPMVVSVLTERRSLQPNGLAGGGPGARGLNILRRADGQEINLGGKASVSVAAGDVLRLLTPGT
ncbi:uncharacterized protein MONBRDRAFT_15677 [Monosiga brevicollis MX1]|uniref:5-oxoprolinase n=1 Tax=Monosiga brevicollis TaxID=81824 RepID=A9UUD3_MONBE|nr:uncharacterized protein MONBRDRAFT_15677 [Monosiga brevicollis MX1]EDQ91076.1 predicted protein [Monosiga brevicollis MX1]|eukprot:XP_001744373.1 hypothetical protein [Monosiga brevicollis MX1]